MKKILNELNVSEFARVLLNYPEEYTIVIKVEGDEDCEVSGTYIQLRETFSDLQDSPIKSALLGKLGELPLVDYDVELSELDIFDYLEFKTKGFDLDRVKIILRELDVFYSMYYKEDSLSDNRDGIDEWNFHNAISILKSKLIDDSSQYDVRPQSKNMANVDCCKSALELTYPVKTEPQQEDGRIYYADNPDDIDDFNNWIEEDNKKYEENMNVYCNRLDNYYMALRKQVVCAKTYHELLEVKNAIICRFEEIELIDNDEDVKFDLTERYKRLDELCSNRIVMISRCSNTESNEEAITTKSQDNISNVEAQKGFQIDEAALLSCFNATFKGAGHNIDYTANLINDLQKKRVGKDYARIALLIQDSRYLITTWKREDFSKWHPHFCKVVGCKYVKYDPCKLRGDEYKKMKEDFYYL